MAQKNSTFVPLYGMKNEKIHTLYDYEIDTKMKILPIDELFGIGKKTSEK